MNQKAKERTQHAGSKHAHKANELTRASRYRNSPGECRRTIICSLACDLAHQEVEERAGPGGMGSDPGHILAETKGSRSAARWGNRRRRRFSDEILIHWVELRVAEVLCPTETIPCWLYLLNMLFIYTKRLTPGA
jgi:hypothetical protein